MKIQIKYNTIYFFLLLLGVSNSYAQKIDTDSLLIALIADTKAQKNPQEIITKAHQAIKIAPDYLDYYVLMGRNFERIPIVDSAQFYYKTVITKSSQYPEVYTYLLNSEIENKQYDAALKTIEEAKKADSEKKDFYDLKTLTIYELQGNQQAQLTLLEQLIDSDSKNIFLKNRYILLSNKLKNDRIGIQYTNTSFNRTGYGPWNQWMLQYIHTREWGSLIGNVNSMNRKSDFTSDVNGLQYEVSSYIFTTERNYLYLNAAYSPDLVFPKYRLGASYFMSFVEKWETNFGLRYTQTQEDSFTSLALGIALYYQSFWFNFNSYIQSDKEKINPAFTLTTRYYFGNRFDYLFGILGYGTSPDDNATAGLYNDRVSLSSYRMGAGISKNIFTHYIFGLQFLYNNQEYFKDKRQNEYEVAVSFQYKF